MIPDDVFDIFEADGHADHVGLDSRGFLLLCVELLMGGRCRMDDQASRIADVRQMREHFQIVDELFAGL